MKCPSHKFVNVTILQLIASGLVRIEIDKDRNCVLCLVINNLPSSYLDGSIWANLFIVDDGAVPTVSTEDE